MIPPDSNRKKRNDIKGTLSILNRVSLSLNGTDITDNQQLC